MDIGRSLRHSEVLSTEVGLAGAAYPSVEFLFSPRGSISAIERQQRRKDVRIKLAPFSFTKIALGLYRNTVSGPLAPNVQGDLLRELHREYPSLTQIPNGVLFTDPAKGRALIIDQTRIEASENSAHVPLSALDQLESDLRKAVPILNYSPPYRVRLEGTGTIQTLEGVSPAAVLRSHAPPNPAWDEIGGTCTHACVRYLFTSVDGVQRDVHVEPLFAQQDKFYVMVVSMTGAPGLPTLDSALAQAQTEADIIERLSDRIVADIVADSQA